MLKPTKEYNVRSFVEDLKTCFGVIWRFVLHRWCQLGKKYLSETKQNSNIKCCSGFEASRIDSVCICICIYICICIFVCICICIFVCISVCICICIFVFVCICSGFEASEGPRVDSVCGCVRSPYCILWDVITSLCLQN